jgi:glycosyltransferase involved in cell wall biosynthesis
VKFLGEQDDVGPILAATDVVVLPSRNEAFGLAAIEGCARGALPIVFSDGGGALEALPPDGVVVEDSASLAQVLDSLVDSEHVSDDARKARSEWLARHFSIESTARGFMDVYAAAMSGAK